MSASLTKIVHQFKRSKVHSQRKTPTQSIHQLTAYRRLGLVTIETRLKDYIIWYKILLRQPSWIKLIATKVELHEEEGLTKSTSSYDVTCLWNLRTNLTRFTIVIWEVMRYNADIHKYIHIHQNICHFILLLSCWNINLRSYILVSLTLSLWVCFHVIASFAAVCYACTLFISSGINSSA